MKKIILIVPLLLFLNGCSDNQKQTMTGTNSITLTSSVFEEGATIPAIYTCEGENISPQLSWSGLPEHTQSIALIMDDPDALHGTWVHWVVFNVPATVTSFAEKANIEALGGFEGVTSFKKNEYSGPCPPSGTHRYYFKLYALDNKLDLDRSADKERLLTAMQGHILAEGQLMGRYKKQQ